MTCADVPLMKPHTFELSFLVLLKYLATAPTHPFPPLGVHSLQSPQHDHDPDPKYVRMTIWRLCDSDDQSYYHP